MKHKIKSFYLGATLTILLISFSIPALSAYQKQATLNYSDIKLMLNGQHVTPKDANGNVVEPFTIDGTTYLPIRGVAGMLGLNVSWDKNTQTVFLSNVVKQVYITKTGSKYHYDNSCNGGTYFPVPMDTAIGFHLEPCNKCVN